MRRTVTPGRCASSRKRFTPAAPRATTMRSSATCASFTKTFRPESVPAGSPSRAMAAGSMDAPSSVSASTPSRSPRAMAGSSRSRCPALAAVTSSKVATTALCAYGPGKHARPISSMSRTTSRMEPSLPPYSEGIRRPGQPRTEISFQSSAEKPRSLDTLSAITLGGHWRRRKSRAVLTRSCWPSERRKSMVRTPSPYPLPQGGEGFRVAPLEVGDTKGIMREPRWGDRGRGWRPWSEESPRCPPRWSGRGSSDRRAGWSR